MTVARSTEACPPITSAKPTRAAPATTAVTRLGTPSVESTKKTEEASSATLKPETERM
jgi:hypothetical protein